MEWAQIAEFPQYSISNDGQVRNENTGRIMVLTRNQHGVVQVGLMKNGIQYKRGVALLVAKAFLDPHPLEAFNTPINVNGDRCDNSIENLMWRPRWFAVAYHKQFHEEPQGFREPVVDIQTGEHFPTSWDAAVKYGLLDKEIKTATINRTYVWPTYQEFRLLE